MKRGEILTLLVIVLPVIALGFVFHRSDARRAELLKALFPVKSTASCEAISRQNLNRWQDYGLTHRNKSCGCGPLDDCCKCKPEEFPRELCFDGTETAFTFNAQIEITEGFYRGYQGAVSRHKDGVYRVAVYRYSGDQKLAIELQAPRFISGVPAAALKAIEPSDPAPLPVPIPIQPTEATK